MHLKPHHINRIGASLWWAGVIGILLLAHTRMEVYFHFTKNTWLSTLFTPDVLENNLSLIANAITPIRGVTLLFSLLVLAYPIFRSAHFFIRSNEQLQYSRIVLQAILAFIILCVIFAPGKIGGLAEEYANTSVVMFARQTTVRYHQRLLMPALAHILFFRGELFYLLFSFISTFCFIFILRLWFSINHIHVSLWKFVSLGTLSFVYFQIQTPGYPDVLINLFVLSAFIFANDTRAKLSLFTLSLASHEASLILWIGLSLLLFDEKEIKAFIAIAILYIAMYLATNNGVDETLAARSVGEVSSVMWVINHPLSEISGIFFSLKALWIIVIGAILHTIGQKQYKQTLQLLLVLSSGVAMTFLGVDTSRLFGWTFMAVLISWKTLDLLGKVNLLNFSLAINLLVPSVNVFLIMAPHLAPGMYEYIFNPLLGF